MRGRDFAILFVCAVIAGALLLVAGMQNRGEARVLRGYAAAGGGHIILWEIAEAGHIGGWQARRNEYAEKVVAFFNHALLGDGVLDKP